MTTPSSETLHATTVAIDGRAVVIEGPSGSGKSDLALRLIDRGAVLVSDDYTLVVRAAGTLRARAPTTIAGRMEVRGIGIVAVAHDDDVPVALVVSLAERIDRMPGDGASRMLAGVAVPLVALIAAEASAPIKVALALKAMAGTVA